MQNKTSQGQKVVSPVLNRLAKWAIFVLNRVWSPGDSAYERGGDARRKFWIKPLRRPIWVWSNHPRFFWSLKETMPKFTPLSETTSIPTPFLCWVPPGFEGHGSTALPRLPLSAPPISAKFWRATITFFSRKEKKGIYRPAGKNMNDWYI